MKRSDKPDRKAARSDAPRPASLVVSFVDRNWLWSRFGLALSLLLAVVIAAVTLTPLPPGPPMLPGVDKIYHFVGFLALVFPVIVTDTNRWAWAVPTAIAFGGAIELIQPMVGRTADWLDFGASVSGVLAGAALAEILHNRIRRSVLGPEPDLHTIVPLESEKERLESLRAELMTELRAVLREELEAAARRNPAAPQGAWPETRQPGDRPGPAPLRPDHATADRLHDLAARAGGRIALRTRGAAFDDIDDDPAEGWPENDMPKSVMPPPPKGRGAQPGEAAPRH